MIAIIGDFCYCNYPGSQPRHLATPLTYLLTYLHPYLLTPWSSVLLDKLTGRQLLKKSPQFYGTRRFITAFTSSRHLALSKPARSIPYPITHYLKTHLNIILSFTPGSPQWVLLPTFPHLNHVHVFPLNHMRYKPRPSNSSRFYHLQDIVWGNRSLSCSLRRRATPLLVASFVLYRLAGYQMTTYKRPKFTASLLPFAAHPYPGPPNSVSATEVTCIRTTYSTDGAWPWKFPFCQFPIICWDMSVTLR